METKVEKRLFDMASDNSPEVRGAVAYAFGEAGVSSYAVINLLISLTADNSPVVRTEAAKALGRLNRKI